MSKPDCLNCYGLYPDGDTPCDKCLKTIPRPEHNDAIRVFLYVRHQLKTVNTKDGLKVLDLDVSALWSTINGLVKVDKSECFEKVMMLGRHFRNEDLL